MASRPQPARVPDLKPSTLSKLFAQLLHSEKVLHDFAHWGKGYRPVNDWRDAKGQLAAILGQSHVDTKHVARGLRTALNEYLKGERAREVLTVWDHRFLRAEIEVARRRVLATFEHRDDDALHFLGWRLAKQHNSLTRPADTDGRRPEQRRGRSPSSYRTIRGNRSRSRSCSRSRSRSRDRYHNRRHSYHYDDKENVPSHDRRDQHHDRHQRHYYQHKSPRRNQADDAAKYAADQSTLQAVTMISPEYNRARLTAALPAPRGASRSQAPTTKNNRGGLFAGKQPVQQNNLEEGEVSDELHMRSARQLSLHDEPLSDTSAEMTISTGSDARDGLKPSENKDLDTAAATPNSSRSGDLSEGDTTEHESFERETEVLKITGPETVRSPMLHDIVSSAAERQDSTADTAMDQDIDDESWVTPELQAQRDALMENFLKVVAWGVEYNKQHRPEVIDLTIE